MKIIRLVKHQNVLRFFQRGAVGVEKTRSPCLEPYPLIAEHFQVGRTQHLVIGALGKEQRRAVGLERPAHRLPQLRQRQGDVPIVPGGAIGRIGQNHIHRMTGLCQQPRDAVHKIQTVRLRLLRDTLVCSPSSRQGNNLHFTHEISAYQPYRADTGLYAASRQSWTSIGVRTPNPRWRRRKL